MCVLWSWKPCLHLWTMLIPAIWPDALQLDRKYYAIDLVLSFQIILKINVKDEMVNKIITLSSCWLVRFATFFYTNWPTGKLDYKS